MKFLVNLFLLFFIYFFSSCSSSDNEETVHKLQPIDYSDFHQYIGTDSKVITIDSDTIVALDTINKYFSTEIKNTLINANKIGFSLLQENKIKYYTSTIQIIADRFDSEDSIYILQNNNSKTPVFVVRENREMANDFFRTISIYRFKYNNVDEQKTVENEELDLNILLKKINLNSIEDLKKGDYLIWANVYYRYK